MRRPLSLVLACTCLLAALLLAGCGDSGSSEGTEAASGGDAPGASTDQTVAWPHFGRLPQRTHYLGEPMRDLDPPLKVAWQINTHALIEYPPALANGVAYVVNKYGNTLAVRVRDRKILWRYVARKREHGAPLDVTGPAYHAGRVYFAAINGMLYSVDAGSGALAWKRNLGGHLESSPLVVGRTLYIGTDGAEVLALDTADGSTRWRFKTPGAVKASASYDDGVVFVADYQSSVFALDARSGKPLWRTNTSRGTPGGRGGFYSSPAVAYGRVFAGRDDGTVFAFDQKTGKVEWSFASGAPIYGSPAVAAVPGTPPTVYIGAENGRLYALSVRDGHERWQRQVGGPVPGTATVIGNTVFTSSFKTGKSVGFDVHTRKRDFLLDSAGYTPVISDGTTLYVAGYYTFFALAPKHAD